MRGASAPATCSTCCSRSPDSGAGVSYKVRIDSFEGPFDLLLYLVSRQKVDIGAISITQIADQYLAEVSRMDNLDLDVASDFLLVASTLLEIKAESLLPRERDDEAMAEVKTKLIKYTDDVNMTQWHRSRAFRQAVTAGLSWLEEGANRDPESELIYSGWEDWRNVYRDSHSRNIDYNVDARYLFRRRVVDLDYAVALLPGSRGAEVEMLSADFLKTAQILRQTYPDLEVVVPLVNAKRREQFERIKAEVAPDLHVRLLDGKGREAMYASDAALLASGTAALECMLAKCPMVVGYRMKPFTFWLAKRLVKTDYVSLPNLLAGRELVKELLQEECEPQKLAAALLPLLANGKTSHAMHDTFRELHQQIRCNADEQAAQAVLELAQ